jgi:hypothetical protein
MNEQTTPIPMKNKHSQRRPDNDENHHQNPEDPLIFYINHGDHLNKPKLKAKMTR